MSLFSKCNVLESVGYQFSHDVHDPNFGSPALEICNHTLGFFQTLRAQLWESIDREIKSAIGDCVITSCTVVLNGGIFKQCCTSANRKELSPQHSFWLNSSVNPCETSPSSCKQQ